MDQPQKANESTSRLAEIEARLRALEREYQTQRHELRAAYDEIRFLNGLQTVALGLVSIREPQSLLQTVVRAAMELMDAEGSSLLLLDEETEQLVFQVVGGEVSQQLVGRSIELGQGIAGWVAETGQSALVNDVQTDPRFSPEIDTTTGFHTVSQLCTPLQFQKQALGVLTVVNKAGPIPFERKDLRWLQTLAALAAVSIANVQLYARLREERDRVLIAQEELRKKLARDLHDGPTQVLSTIVMQAEYIKKLVEHEPEQVGAEMDRLSQVGRRAVREMRTMLFDLRPLVLETQGIVAALQLFTERHQVAGGPQILLHVDGHVGRFASALESATFSIVQEAVNNALKHAAAQNIWLRVSMRNQTLVIEIEDDGYGFDMESVLRGYDSRGSFGLLSMRERAEIVGGELTVVSAVGQGTTVMLRVPTAAEPEEEEGNEWLVAERRDEEQETAS
jgi:signal transduction histidine kinase